MMVYISRFSSFCCTVSCLIIAADLLEKGVRCSPGEESETQHDYQADTEQDVNYMSYLNWPRLHFRGVHRADSASINNDPLNFDAGNFAKPSPSWNPMGSGEWSVNASVTKVCYANEVCKSIADVPVVDRGSKAFAKMVDLDVEAQSFAEIWGWGIRVGNWFEGDFTPTSFQYPWWKMGPDYNTDDGYGATYTSVLTNIAWLDEENEFVKEILKYKPERLSIHFNMDRYMKDSTSANFTWGHVTGVIGVAGRFAPPFFVGHGRMLRPREGRVHNAPFVLDTFNKRVIIDFGNSLPITSSGSMNTILLDTLVVAIDKSDKPNFDCSDELLWLGVVNNKLLSDWYASSTGIQAFPSFGRMTDEQETLIEERPLVVIEVEGSQPDSACSRVVLAEHHGGLHVHPFNRWTNRYEAGDTAEFQFVVTRFGQEAHDKEITFRECLAPLFVEEGTPAVGLPPLPESVPRKSKTNEKGIATVKIKTGNPINNRTYIDGQLYSFCYSVTDGPPAHEMSPDNVIVIKVYNEYPDVQFPTWLDHIYPIFKQYAHLYPVMTENFVDLGNYYEVKEYRTTIENSMELDISHPNYMPVTRDLSEAKRKVILRWLDNPNLPIGEWNTQYSLRHLRRDLQIALQIEHATIPTYLTALATIKEGYNLEVQAIFRTVLVQEMLHMSLLANILNALGAAPKLYYDGFVPEYPSPLPGGVQPRLTVPIEKCSVALISDVFMKIEKPSNDPMDADMIHGYSFDNVQEFGQVLPDSVPCKPGQHSCFRYLSTHGVLAPRRRRYYAHSQDSSSSFTYPSSSIGELYENIKEQLKALSAQQGDLFVGDPDKQIELRHVGSKYAFGSLFKVADLDTALAAIDEIVKEGEGSSPCNPYSYHRKKSHMSHYFLFKSIVEKREMGVRIDEDATHGGQNAKETDSNSMRTDKRCPFTLDFKGPEIPFDEDGVWPMIKNPQMSIYKPGSRAHYKAFIFNQAYTRLLKALQEAFNGKPDDLRNALGLMHSVELHMKNLVRTPLNDEGNPENGPNAGPTFTFTPEV